MSFTILIFPQCSVDGTFDKENRSHHIKLELLNLNSCRLIRRKQHMQV